MLLYHGSDAIIGQPVYGIGREDNDYGSGFYMTDDKEMANAWAVANGRERSYCNKYELSLENMNVLYLDNHGTLAWIAEVVAHRGTDDENYEFLAEELISKYKMDTSEFDVIVGYRADDSYMQVTDAFLRGTITVEEVARFFKEGDLGEQYFLKSEKAFEEIKFIGAEVVLHPDQYNNYDESARRYVQKFLRARDYAIQVQRLQPQGLTIWNVLDTQFEYDSDTGYYRNLLRRTL